MRKSTVFAAVALAVAFGATSARAEERAWAWSPLGIGSAATPLGIEAVRLMQGDNPDATDHTALFIVINACGVQLLPATVIALRQQAGSASPADIFLPTVISTLLTAAIGVTLCVLTRGRKGLSREKHP